MLAGPHLWIGSLLVLNYLESAVDVGPGVLLPSQPVIIPGWEKISSDCEIQRAIDVSIFLRWEECDWKICAGYISLISGVVNV